MMNMITRKDHAREAKRIWDIQGRLFIMPLSAKQIRCEMGGLAADTRDYGIR